MAYFRCAFSNSGATLTVECDSFMAGAIVTCSNGVKTLQGLCPPTSPYEVTFKIPEEGTWVVSTVVSGATYSTSVDIDFSFEASLSGFNWMLWLTEGGLDPSDYNDLSEVLADEKALRQLNLVHASVDYMASIIATHPDVETIIAEGLFAKWANLSDYALDKMEANAVLSDLMDDADLYGYGELIEDNGSYVPKGNVPTMTSNSAPYGEASADSAISGHEAYKVFDGDDTTYWRANDKTGDIYVTYKFTNPVKLSKFRFKSTDPLASFQQRVSQLSVKTSNDGSTWDTLKTIDTSGLSSLDLSDDVESSDYCLYARFNLTKANSNGVSVNTIQFYGRELKVSVPTMTGSTVPYGEASASHASSSYPAWQVFDNNDSTAWSSGVNANCWVRYESIKPMRAEFVKIKVYKGGSGNLELKNFKIQGSNDGTNWDDLYTGLVPVGGTDLAFTLDNPTNYKYHRLYAIDTYHTSVGILTLQFYGKDYSEKEFANDGSKWLYDHGVELEEISQYNTSASYWGGTVTKKSNSIALLTPHVAYGTCGASTQKINLTNYNLLRGAINQFAAISSSSQVSVGVNNGTDTTFEAIDGNAAGGGNLPNNLGIDISSVNEQAFVCMLVSNNASPAPTPDTSAEFAELWLE